MNGYELKAQQQKRWDRVSRARQNWNAGHPQLQPRAISREEIISRVKTVYGYTYTICKPANADGCAPWVPGGLE